MDKRVIKARDVMHRNHVEMNGMATVRQALEAMKANQAEVVIIEKRDEHEASVARSAFGTDPHRHGDRGAFAVARKESEGRQIAPIGKPGLVDHHSVSSEAGLIDVDRGHLDDPIVDRRNVFNGQWVSPYLRNLQHQLRDTGLEDQKRGRHRQQRW